MHGGAPAGAAFRFGPFHLIGPEGPLLRDAAQVHLPPKSLRLLWLLARQPGAVVTRAALRDALWPGMAAGDEALTREVEALRAALGDSARHPQYLATVHRAGYRLLAPAAAGARLMVGREVCVEQLDAVFAEAAKGRRQFAFVSGEAGIGKSTLIDQWLHARLAADGNLLVARGHCPELRERNEPHHPLLQALEQLTLHADGAQVLEMMAALAPAWLAPVAGRRGPHEAVAGATRERMLRELAELLDALARSEPLVLALEDLHLSDSSTIEALDLLARRSGPSRLMLVCSYSPMQAIVDRHPVNVLRHELMAQRLCVDCMLGSLAAPDVELFLRQRFPQRPQLRKLSARLHRRTEGQPLFMAQAAADLGDAAAGAEAKAIDSLPESLPQLIAGHIARCNATELELLEVASLAGMEFAAAAVAAAMDLPVETVERHCDTMLRQQRFIEDRGLAIWPDGMVSARYGFRHALYHAALAARAGSGLRARRHALLGARLESAWGDRAREIAAALAAHFHDAGDAAKAIEYSRTAAGNALALAAAEQAIPHLQRALALIRAMPSGAPRDAQELQVQTSLGVAFMSAAGLGSPQAAEAFIRAQELCAGAADDAGLSLVLWGIFRFRLIRAEFDVAGEIAERMSALAQSRAVADQSAHLNLQHQLACASLHLYRGEYPAAQPVFDAAAAGVEQGRGLGAAPHDHDLCVNALAAAAWLSWTVGKPDEARQRSARALSLARSVSRPGSLALALYRAAGLHEMLREYDAARGCADELLDLSREQGLVHWQAAAEIMHAAMAVECGAADADEQLARMRAAIVLRRQMGVGLGLTYDHALLARACLKLGRHDEGLAAAREGRELVLELGERIREVDLLTLEGELLTLCSAPDLALAEDRLTEALALAERQDSPAWKQHASLALARLSSGRVAARR